MKIPENVGPDDDFEIWCRKLGHQIHFSFCRREDSGQPCFKIIDCWHPYFPVEELLCGELTEKVWQSVFERSRPPKILSLIEQAQKRTQEKVKGKDRKK